MFFRGIRGQKGRFRGQFPLDSPSWGNYLVIGYFNCEFRENRASENSPNFVGVGIRVIAFYQMSSTFQPKKLPPSCDRITTLTDKRSREKVILFFKAYGFIASIIPSESFAIACRKIDPRPHAHTHTTRSHFLRPPRKNMDRQQQGDLDSPLGCQPSPTQNGGNINWSPCNVNTSILRLD